MDDPCSVIFFLGYDGTADWDEYSRYVNPEGVEMTSVSSISLFWVLFLWWFCLVWVSHQ